MSEWKYSHWLYSTHYGIDYIKITIIIITRQTDLLNWWTLVLYKINKNENEFHLKIWLFMCCMTSISHQIKRTSIINSLFEIILILFFHRSQYIFVWWLWEWVESFNIKNMNLINRSWDDIIAMMRFVFYFISSHEPPTLHVGKIPLKM